MKKKNTKIETGFSFLDQKWGGVYSGGNYFIFGSKKSGKTILALNIIEHLVQSNYKVLLLTSDRSKNLEIQAASIEFNINKYITNDLLVVQRLNESYNDISSIKNIIHDIEPNIIFINEIIDENISEIEESYIEFIEYLEERDLTTFILSSVPQNEKLKKFVKKIAKNSTGIIQLQKSISKKDYSGSITLKPNVGHFEGEFDTTYKVEPVKGFITLADNESSILNLLKQNKSLFNNPLLNQNFEYSNIYNVDEFKFLVESKIAFSSDSGEQINILTYEVLNNSISTIELCNALKNVLDKGDKLAYTENMVFVLPGKTQIDVIKKMSNNLDTEIQKLLNVTGDFNNYIKKKQQLLNSNFII